MMVLLLAAVLITSALSGVLGMGGGLILMGVLSMTLPVATAMVVHGTAQLTANGARAILHRRHIAWHVLPPYLVGAALGTAIFFALGVTTKTWIVQLGIGLFPFLALYAKRFERLSIERVPDGILCGVAVTALQLLAGASGPVLDVFYLRTKLGRHQVVATKALTQTIGHGLKLVYYGGLVAAAPDLGSLPLGAWILPLIVLVAIVGTYAGGMLLDRLSDARFQRWSRHFILAVGAVYLVLAVRSFSH